MKRIVWILTALFMIISFSCRQGPDYPGYTLISKKYVKEVNADCYYFEHDRSGAKVFKIAADDPNKTFSIMFKTITDSDCGTPHIMEHSVLNGSKNFPVKSPFDEMAKGSLRTFLNAMTGKDVTTYPAASMNMKDYFNLMHVYFDAVFNPLIYDNPQIFQQEGWHHELTDAGAPVVYKGVVYNEMKGAFSSPDRELSYQTFKYLFPDNCYRFSSGGYPDAIPDLTYEKFIEYHRKHYHPSNSYILLYGDADLGKELEFMDTAYLSNYERAEMELNIPVHEPFEELREIVKPYSVPEGSNTEDQTMLRLSFVVGDGSDMSLNMAMGIIREVLVNQESAPLRLALQDEGIGRDITASNSIYRQQVFHMTVRNASLEDKERFRETVFRTLGRVVEEGLDKEAVEGAINRLEFRLREGNDAQKGITYGSQIKASWMYVNRPFEGLEYERPLDEVKKALDSDYLEQIIRERMINNPHALLIALEPEPGLEKEINERTAEKLESYKAGLSVQEVDALVQTTEDLLAAQDREDSPEALASIPKLSLSDVKPETQWYMVEEKDLDSRKLLYYEAFTNNVIYTDLMFDMRVIPPDLIPYLSVLREVLGKLDTKNRTYSELEKDMNIHTGGFRSSLQSYTDLRQADHMTPEFSVGVKVVKDKTDRLVELVDEILLKTEFSDTTRLRNILNQHLARVEASVKSNGFNYAATRMLSYFNQEGMFFEVTSGMEYYWFLKDLMVNYEENAEMLVRNLEEISSLLFNADNLIFGVTCSRDDYPLIASGLVDLAGRFPDGRSGLKEWNLMPEVKNEGFMAASKVQYVLQGTDYKKLGQEFSGHMMVLNNVINSEWLHPQIRVKGGAYGGFGVINQEGLFVFGSYRDPNLAETLENFAGTTGFIHGFEADSAEMIQYIIGTIADLDQPRTPAQQGNIAISNYFTHSTREEQQRIRKEVLSTTPADIHALAPLVQEVLDQNTYCVYGNQEKILANRGLFNSVMPIMN